MRIVCTKIIIRYLATTFNVSDQLQNLCLDGTIEQETTVEVSVKPEHLHSATLRSCLMHFKIFSDEPRIDNIIHSRQHDNAFLWKFVGP